MHINDALQSIRRELCYDDQSSLIHPPNSIAKFMRCLDFSKTELSLILRLRSKDQSVPRIEEINLGPSNGLTKRCPFVRIALRGQLSMDYRLHMCALTMHLLGLELVFLTQGHLGPNLSELSEYSGQVGASTYFLESQSGSDSRRE